MEQGITQSRPHPTPKGQNLSLGPSPSSWGAKRLEQLPPSARRMVARAAQLRRRLAPALPLVPVAVMLLLMALVYFNEQHYNTKQGYKAVAGFADIGTGVAGHLGLQDLVPDPHNPIGFDGQFYYIIALDPSQLWICAEKPQPERCGLDPAFGEVRAERILYPALAGLLTLGQPDLLPYTLLLVNFVAILLIAGLVGQLSVEAGASRWLGAAAGLFCGGVLGFLRDLADPFAVMWVVLAVYLLRRGRYGWAALAVAAALLTREQLILTLPLLWLPLLVRREWRNLLVSLLLGVGPFLVWQTALRVVWGKWGILSGDPAGAGVAGAVGLERLIPFWGLWQDRLKVDFGIIVALVVVPLVLVVVIAVLAVWWRGPRYLVREDSLPLVLVVYTLLLSLTSGILWQDMWTPGRLAAVAVVLAVIVVAGLPTPRLRIAYGTILALSSIAPLMLVIR